MPKYGRVLPTLGYDAVRKTIAASQLDDLYLALLKRDAADAADAADTDDRVSEEILLLITTTVAKVHDAKNAFRIGKVKRARSFALSYSTLFVVRI